MKRGFSLVELVMALGLALLACAFGFMSLRSALGAVQHARTSDAQRDALTALVSRFEEEASSSDAVWIMQKTNGAELHFSRLTGDGTTQHWFYTMTSQGLARVDGFTNTTSIIDPGKNLAQFSLTTLQASALGQTGNPYNAAFRNLPAVANVEYTVDGVGIAGNSVCVVILKLGKESRMIHLLAGANAESFGIEQGLFWHAILWRTTSTHRFALGLGQKTSYHIMAEIAYTTNNWASSKVWCSYDVYGPLDVSDPRAQASYHDRAEQASTIFAACQKITGQRAIVAPSVSQ